MWFSDGFFGAQPSKVQTVWHLAGSVPKNSWDNREVFSDDCKDIDTKIEDTKREMLEEWKDIPDANK